MPGTLILPMSGVRGSLRKRHRGCAPIKPQCVGMCRRELIVGFFKSLAARHQGANRLGKHLRIEFRVTFRHHSDRSTEERGAEKSGDSLRAMARESVNPDLAIILAPEGRDF